MKITRLSLLSGLLPILLSACDNQPLPSADPPTHLLTNVIVIDGTGAPRQAASVRIQGSEIIEIGDLNAKALETVTDGGGLVLAPGFIDTHSHADADLFISQGPWPRSARGLRPL